MGQGSAKNLAVISGVTITGTPTTGQILTAYSANSADWQTPSISTALPFVFQPGGTAEDNVFITEASLNTALGAAHGPQTVYFDFSHNSDAFTTTVNDNFGTFMIGIANPANGATPTITSSFAITSNVFSIRDLSFIQASGTTFSSALAYFELRGQASVYASGGGAIVSNITGGSGCYAYDASNIGDGTNPTFSISSTGNLTINMFDRSVLEAGAVTIAGGGSLNINVMSSAAFIDTSYASLSGCTINYIAANLGPVAVTGTPSTGQVLTATSSTAADWQTPSAGALTIPIVFLPSGAAQSNVFNNESSLNTYVNSVFGPQTVYTSFASTTGNYTASGNLNLGSYIYAVLGDYADQAPVLTTASQITTPFEIHDLQISTSAGPNFPNQAPYLKLYGIAGLKSTDNSAIYTVTFPDILDMYGTSYLGDGTNQVIHVSSTGNLTINIYDSATINAGALVVDAGGTVIINVRSPSTSIASGYLAGFTGVTINYLFAGTNITGGIQTGTFALASGTVSVPANINSGNTVVVITLTGLSGTPPYANQYAVNALSVGASGTGGSFTVTAYDVSGSAVTSDNSTFSYIIIG